MLSFHNDPAIKQRYIDRINMHMLADNIIQGTGWENGRGCAVGCTLENYDHSRYPIELGLPEWLAKLEDIIFEGLPNNLSEEWPLRFLQAIPVGIDVEIIKHQLTIIRMNRLIKIQTNALGKNSENIDNIIIQTIDAIKLIIQFSESEINKNYCDLPTAMKSAESVAESAWSAVESAESAAARSAAWSARSAAKSAALSAAWPAESAAWSAASAAAWQQESDDLIMLLENLKE